MSEKKIIGLREEINRLDRAVLDLLNQRAAYALEIGRLKQKNGQPVFEPSRERDLLAALSEDNQGPLPGAAVMAIFREIISACRALQGPTRVSYLGPQATFSHMAAVSFFGASCTFQPRGAITDVFREVAGGGADFGVVPLENSTEGAVGLTLDELVTTDLNICGEVCLPVSHTLMSLGDDLSAVKSVLSHPQALAQCRGWLARNLPDAALIETSSTAAAAQRAAQESGAAAVGSEMLADRHGLKVLAENIQNRQVNLTRFAVLGRLECARTGRDKTSTVLSLPHEPGTLSRALTPLARAGINLTRIESRPAPGRPWNYVFFIDFEGHITDAPAKKALAELAPGVEVKVLGSYPAADKAGQDSISDTSDMVGPACAQTGQ